jgi:Spy/CpxP family protein refolding chaperone
MILFKYCDGERSSKGHFVINKQQIITPLFLIMILLAGITGCKSSDNQPKATENSSSTSEVNSSGNNQARSPEGMKRREETRNQVKAVLTPEQIKELDSKMQAGEKMRQALTSINLSTDQKTKIEAIYQAMRANRPAK